MARASRNRTEKGQQKLKQAYGKLLETTSRVVGQAQKFSQEIAQKVKRGDRAILRKAKKPLDAMMPRVQQVMRPAGPRVWEGNTRVPGKLVRMFETYTAVIRKGKTSKPNEFGKLVKVPEAEHQIIRTTQSAHNVRPIPSCWCRRWNSMSANLDEYPTWWRPIRDSSRRPTRPRRRRWVCSASRFPAMPPKARPASSGKSSAGSRSYKNGAPDVRAASVF